MTQGTSKESVAVIHEVHTPTKPSLGALPQALGIHPVACGVLAALVAVAALGGIFLPSTYARETASWAAQGVGQDWLNLAIVAPGVVITGVLAQRGSVKAGLLLGGGLVYIAYSFAIYAFAVHFNRLFLIYCATLGLAGFALVGQGARFFLTGTRGWVVAQAPARAAGILLAVMSVLFAALWLVEVLPAMARGTVPASVGEAGQLVNPVHVLDLSFVLPAMLAAGVSLWRRRPLGLVLGPILLSFAALMTAAIAAMMLVMHGRGLPVELAVALPLAGLTLTNVGVLGALLRKANFPAAVRADGEMRSST